MGVRLIPKGISHRPRPNPVILAPLRWSRTSLSSGSGRTVAISRSSAVGPPNALPHVLVCTVIAHNPDP